MHIDNILLKWNKNELIEILLIPGMGNVGPGVFWSSAPTLIKYNEGWTSTMSSGLLSFFFQGCSYTLHDSGSPGPTLPIPALSYGLTCVYCVLYEFKMDRRQLGASWSTPSAQRARTKGLIYSIWYHTPLSVWAGMLETKHL